jgi:2-C-methyl-D-erythritol 2,4-cyclodiphosphate synthase
LEALPDHSRSVAIHDAARPFVSEKLIAATISRLDGHHGAVPGLPLVDTLRLQEQGLSRGVRDRDSYVLTQTPQCFHRDILVEALDLAEKDGFSGTDDASYVERLPGTRIAVVGGESANFKITGEDDLERARALLQAGEPLDFRCGEGYDVHCLVPGRPLILGGVTIPFERGLEGHSDADVLCHAVGDALLGAAALGDLGRHFPDNDPDFKGISSLILLARIREMITLEGYAASNVDATLILQEPRIAPHAGDMIANLAEVLQVRPGRVSVKATTTEGLGLEGRGEGISCRAVAGIRSIR